MTADKKPDMYVLVTRYDPGDGKKVVTHVYGPRTNTGAIYTMKKRVLAEANNDPRLHISVCKVLDA